MTYRITIGLLAAMTLLSFDAQAETQPDDHFAVLQGLAPVSALATSEIGNAALAANLTVTGGIQTGTLRQATLLPFAAQQQQALRDAFITFGNLAELADGLGTTLGAAYEARAHYLDHTHFTSVSPAMADLIAYTVSLTGSDAGAGKFFFANATTDGKTPVSDKIAEIYKTNGGAPDVFGRAYAKVAGSAGSDRFGDARPFQTEPVVASIVGPDYLDTPSDNYVYNRGPMMDLVDSPSYPSGHTTYGYSGAILLAVLVPERYSQMIARGAEYGNDRIVVGAHYAMDVLGGRALATYDMAHLLANDPAYMGRTVRHAPVIGDYQAALKQARADLTEALKTGCGAAVEACAGQDIGRFSDPEAVEAFYASTQTYGLPVVHAETVAASEDVAKLAPEAGYLLTAAFPSLSLDQANAILTATEGPGGGFLDDGSAFGVYSRLDLYAAGKAAMRAAVAPTP